MNQPLRPADDAAVPASGQTQTQGGQAQTHGSPGQRQDQDQAQDQADATLPPVRPRRPPPPGPRLLQVTHETCYDYDAPVEVAHHSAWLRPRDTEVQKVQRWDLQIDPLPESAVQESKDAFGNWRHGFSHSRVHDRLTVTSRFQVLLTTPPQLDDAHSPPWEEAAAALRYRAGVTQPEAVEFVLPSQFAPHAPELAAYAHDLFSPGRPLLQGAQALMTRVHQRMQYKPHSTDVATNALQALAQGQGVCQDFAHLMIAALRAHGLPARYVSGYLLTDPPPGQERLQGVDASHAWVAAYAPAVGWVEFDPTNDQPADARYITLAWGADFGDVAPLRGVITGGGEHTLSVAVSVMPA